MSNPFQLQFTLKQHTPIIHFQHEQSGATLRATEVKPKLDLFIIKNCLRTKGILWQHDQDARDNFKNAAINPGQDKDKKEWKNWLLGKGRSEHVALEYKVGIYDSDQRSISDRSYGGFKLITDDIDDTNKPLPKKAMESNNIVLQITCIQNSLKKFIEAIIPTFFAVTNFGTRQNKGWGCFYHESHKNWDNLRQCLLSSGEVIYCYNNDVDFDQYSDFYSRNLVGIIWKPLKSGINLYNREGRQIRYSKALSFKYLGEKGFRWDKRWMKLEVKRMIDNGVLPAQLTFKNSPNNIGNSQIRDRCSNNFFNTNDWDNGPEDSYRFIRAILGLAEHIEFRAQRGYIYQVVINSPEGVERFKAPITFKVFKNKLYAVVNTHESNTILGKKFYFNVQKKLRPQGGGTPESEGDPIMIVTDNQEPKYLYTPIDNSEFDILEFLDNYLSCVGFSRLISQ